MHIRIFGLALAVLLVSPFAGASDASSPSPLEWASAVADRQADIDLAVAPIRSHADLQAYLRHHRDSPLHRLRPEARQRFIDGLVFTEKGLASYSFLPIEGRIGVTETYRLLSLFGLQSSIGAIRGLRAVNATERAMLEASGISLMAAKPHWRHGICVIHGPSPGKCIDRYGFNCSRACD